MIKRCLLALGILSACVVPASASPFLIELFTELDQMKDESLGYFDPRPWHEDTPQRPKAWGPGTSSNYWGLHQIRADNAD